MMALVLKYEGTYLPFETFLPIAIPEGRLLFFQADKITRVFTTTLHQGVLWRLPLS